MAHVAEGLDVRAVVGVAPLPQPDHVIDLARGLMEAALQAGPAVGLLP